MRFFLALVVLCALVACAYAFTDLGRVQQQLGGVVKVDQTPAQSRSKRQSIFSGAGAGFLKVDRKQPPQVPRPSQPRPRII
uniref:Secreted protein n=1 Tax=Acrobeloides nanus TaxID=290746 RepID=A0A914E8X1_9BILA